VREGGWEREREKVRVSESERSSLPRGAARH
jgi:hypothetical protein